MKSKTNNRVTAEQMEYLQKAAACVGEPIRAKMYIDKAVDAGLSSATLFRTEPEVAIALQASLNTLDPNHKGFFGIGKETYIRARRKLATGHAVRWLDLHKRTDVLPDLRIRLKDGKMITVEIKTGAGDWGFVHTPDLDTALEEYGERGNDFVIWDTEEFRFCGTRKQLLSYLGGYSPKKGIKTFFNSQIRPCEDRRGVYRLRLQTYSTSRRKIDYLTGLEQIGYDLWTLIDKGELVAVNR